MYTGLTVLSTDMEIILAWNGVDLLVYDHLLPFAQRTCTLQTSTLVHLQTAHYWKCFDVLESVCIATELSAISTNSSPLIPTNSSSVVPTNSSAVVPTNSSAVVPTNSSAVVPTNSSAVVLTNSSAVVPTNSSAVALHTVQ